MPGFIYGLQKLLENGLGGPVVVLPHGYQWRVLVGGSSETGPEEFIVDDDGWTEMDISADAVSMLRDAGLGVSVWRPIDEDDAEMQVVDEGVTLRLYLECDSLQAARELVWEMQNVVEGRGRLRVPPCFPYD